MQCYTDHISNISRTQRNKFQMIRDRIHKIYYLKLDFQITLIQTTFLLHKKITCKLCEYDTWRQYCRVLWKAVTFYPTKTIWNCSIIGSSFLKKNAFTNDKIYTRREEGFDKMTQLKNVTLAIRINRASRLRIWFHFTNVGKGSKLLKAPSF